MTLAALPAPAAPPLLYDEDGCLGAIRDNGRWTPQLLFREAVDTDAYLWEDAFDWVEVPGSDGEFHRPTFSQYKEVLAGFSLVYWRIAETEEEKTYGVYGDETYFSCPADYPTAIGYWDLGTVF